MIAGPQRRTRVMNDKEKLITAYHEGGHALAAAAMRHTDPVTKVTILPRGRALGYTMVLPLEDKYSVTRNELLDQLAYAMGGRVAEEIVFHDPTTGASNDIEKATAIARKMVTEYGMSAERRRRQARLVRRRGLPRPRHGPPARLLARSSPRRSTSRCARSSSRRTTRRATVLNENRDILDTPRQRAPREGDARPHPARRDLRGRQEAPRAPAVALERQASAQRPARRSRSRRRPRSTRRSSTAAWTPDARAEARPASAQEPRHRDSLTPGSEKQWRSTPRGSRRPSPSCSPRSARTRRARACESTPRRVAEAYAEFFAGIGEDPLDHLSDATRARRRARRARRAGAAARHRLPLGLRAPPAAVHRRRPPRLPARRADRRPRPPAAGRRDPELAPAAAGAPRRADRRRDRDRARPARRARRARRPARLRHRARHPPGRAAPTVTVAEPRHAQRARRAGAPCSATIAAGGTRRERPSSWASLNVTPDSFSDGGRWQNPDAAIAHGVAMRRGGRRHRRRRRRVDAARRGHRRRRRRAASGSCRSSASSSPAASRSASTPCTPSTALAAVDAGAEIINDVSGGLADDGMARVVAETGVHFVAMHWRGGADVQAEYRDVVAEVRSELRSRVAQLVVAGVAAGADRPRPRPRVRQGRRAQLAAARATRRARDARPRHPDRRIAQAVPRRRCCPRARPMEDRDPPTAVISALAARAGVWAVRVHDVAGDPGRPRCLGALAGWSDDMNLTRPITLTGLRAFAHHGVFEHERRDGQGSSSTSTVHLSLARGRRERRPRTTPCTTASWPSASSPRSSATRST